MHFYGMSLEQVDNMAYKDAFMLYRSVRVIESQKALMAMDIADYPHLKKQDRKKIYSNYKSQTKLEDQEENYFTTDQFFAMAGGKVNRGK